MSAQGMLQFQAVGIESALDAAISTCEQLLADVKQLSRCGVDDKRRLEQRYDRWCQETADMLDRFCCGGSCSDGFQGFIGGNLTDPWSIRGIFLSQRLQDLAEMRRNMRKDPKRPDVFVTPNLW
uniref:Uncharacterized protein n=1 Tax=mine drainage metagenome TaxID=410659 RepID=E6Q8T2_9ZZZZ